MSGTVYVISCDVDDRVYVGSTTKLKVRLQRHRNELRDGTHHNVWMNSIALEHGADVFHTDPVYTGDDFREIECELIRRLQLVGGCFNIQMGVSGGDALTYHPERQTLKHEKSASMFSHAASRTFEQRSAARRNSTNENNSNYRHGRCVKSTRRMCSECDIVVLRSSTAVKCTSCLAKARTGELNSFYGKTHSEKSKRLIAEKNRGRRNPAICKPVVIDGVTYQSLSDASNATGVPTVTIRWRVLSPNPKFANYHYANNEQDQTSSIGVASD